MGEEDWIIRLRQEKRELDVRIGKLDAFITSNSLFEGFESSLRSLFVGQLATMMHYSMILGLRLKRIDEVTE